MSLFRLFPAYLPWWPAKRCPGAREVLFTRLSHLRQRASQRGQAMVEYVIVVALVAVAAIAVYQLFGQVIRSQTAAMAREIAGEDGSEQSRMAQSAAESAAAQTAAKTLKSFTGNAAAGQ
jgi:Flp pilus assembly pilin Flp